MVDYRIRINEAKRELEITKAFANKANKYGTSEYDDLQKARRDYPKFKVVIRHTKKNVDGFKGLTLEYMEKYIKAIMFGRYKKYLEYQNCLTP